MKKIASLVFVLMALTVGSAFAAGLDVSWDDCWGIGATNTKVVTCTNSGTAVQNLFLSFVVDQSIPSAGSTDAIIDVQTQNAVGSWWLNAARFGSTTGPSSCDSWFGAAQKVFIGPDVRQTSSNRLRLRTIVSVVTGQEQALAPATEYFANTFQLFFGPGTFANAECVGGAGFSAQYLRVLQPGGAPPTEILQLEDQNACATFRSPTGNAACPNATPTHKTTWGSIKAIYR